MQRRNGCKTPHKKGRGLRTSIGTEILTCPRKDVPPHIAAYVDAYQSCGGEMTLTEARNSSPILVDAFSHIKDVMAQLQAADMKAMKDKHSGNGAR